MKSPKEIISIDYDTLPIETREIIWFGTLLYFSRPHNFPEGNDWSYLITASEIVIYQDENIRLTVGYGGSEYTIEYYNGNDGFSGDFETFFDSDYKWEHLNLELNLGKEYRGISLTDYIRMHGFPITSEFWSWDGGYISTT